MDELRFRDRQDAGVRLSQLLTRYTNTNAVVLAIPRGGVVTAKVVSDRLNLPLGLLIVRKIGSSFNPEYAIASVSESGILIKNEEEVGTVNEEWFRDAINEQLVEVKRRREKYWGNRGDIELKNKVVIIIDDGLATGLTMRAAIQEVKSRNPSKIIVAVPISPSDVADKLKPEVDEFIACSIPDFFEGAVGSYYDQFPQVEDEEVITILNKSIDPILFYMSNFAFQAQKILELPNYSSGEYKVTNFPNLEFQVRIESAVKGLPTVFLGTISPPYNQTLEALFVCHTLKKEGAASVTAILPYLSFMRHEKNKPGEDQASSLIASFLKDCGVSGIITFDIHSENDLKFFDIPVSSLSVARLFADKIQEMDFHPSSIVAPDVGATLRADKLKNILGDVKNLVVFSKVRIVGKELITNFVEGEVGDKAVIVDDILDTGQTLLNCVKILNQKGVKEIVICVTHGLFSGDNWKELFDYGVKKIFVSDSIPLVREIISDKVEVVPAASIVTQELLHSNVLEYL